jgi:hypothetical protein
MPISSTDARYRQGEKTRYCPSAQALLRSFPGHDGLREISRDTAEIQNFAGILTQQYTEYKKTTPRNKVADGVVGA